MRRANLRVFAATAFVSAAATLGAQTLNPSPQAVISQTRTLTTAEVAQVLAATRSAIAGMTVRLAYKSGGPGPEVLMAADGRPRIVRAVSGYTSWSGWASSGSATTSQQYHANVTEVTDFTGLAARRCDGAPAGGELVIEYRNENDAGWTAKARTRTRMEFATPIFDMLTGAVASESGERRLIGDRPTRAFVAPWQPPPGVQPGGPLPANLSQSLWIDVETLLPLRWEMGGPSMPAYGLSFNYERLDIGQPGGVTPPDCIQ